MQYAVLRMQYYILLQLVHIAVLHMQYYICSITLQMQYYI